MSNEENLYVLRESRDQILAKATMTIYALAGEISPVKNARTLRHRTTVCRGLTSGRRSRLAVVDDEIACARGRARPSHRTKSTVRPRPDHVGEVVANALEISVVRGRPARPPPAGFVRHTSERAQRV